MSKESELITPSEAVEYLKELGHSVTESTLATWRSRGRGGQSGPQFYKIGALVKYKKEDLKRWLDSITKRVNP